MRSLRYLFLALGLATAGGAAPTPAELAPVAGFVGGVWVAKLPPAPDGTAGRIELVFAAAANGQGVRFDSWVVKGERRRPYCSGLYAWNAARRQLLMVYTDSQGALTEGFVTVAGDVLGHELTETNADGSVDHVRVTLTKRSADEFIDDIAVANGNAWAHVATVRYQRQNAS